MLKIIRVLRLPNLLIMGGAPAIAYYFLWLPTYLQEGGICPLSFWDLLFISLMSVFLGAAGYAINDYHDREIDAINKPKRAYVGSLISPQTLLRIYYTLAALGMMVAIALDILHQQFFWSWHYPIFTLLLWAYSRQLKMRFFIGNLAVAFVCGEGTLWLWFQAHLTGQAIPYFISYLSFGACVFAFLSTIMRELVKDAEDAFGDSQHGATTLPVVWGTKATNRIVRLLCFVTAIGLLHWMNPEEGWQVIYAGGLAAFPVCVLAAFVPKEKRDYAMMSTLLKVWMLAGLGLVFCTAYFNP